MYIPLLIDAQAWVEHLAIAMVSSAVLLKTYRCVPPPPQYSPHPRLRYIGQHSANYYWTCRLFDFGLVVDYYMMAADKV
jgi:hypothetical protein